MKILQIKLKDLKANKATGLDKIPARLLKDSASVMAPSLTHIVNLSLLTGVVPDEWKKARVVPLFKSGGQEIMDNYRPISIHPVVSKIAEKAVNVQLQLYLKQNDLLSPFQSGFRQYHSTLTAVTFFCDTTRGGIDIGKQTEAVFIDFRKAFDSVPHDALIAKLKRFVIRGNSLDWFSNYLYNRTQAVSIGNIHCQIS